MARAWIQDWNPEDEEFWERRGKFVARRNLIFSIFAEFLGFAVWSLWSVTGILLNEAGFEFSAGQLFTLAAVPAIVGATVRFPYTLAVPKFGGRNWTIFSVLLLLLPVALLAFLVSRPDSPFWAFLLGAAFAGVGGGNFASSMANISFFYPDSKKGFALGLNAAGGNLGVAVAQLVIPIAVTWHATRWAGGGGSSHAPVIANAGLIWVPFILLAALCAWLFMDNLTVSASGFKEHSRVLKRKQTWIVSVLYVGTFGSFIGFSAGLPLLIKTEFPGITMSIAFLGPLVGSLSRPLGGWLADRLGGARITFATFLVMGLSVSAVIFCLAQKTEPWAFAGFFSAFVILFLLSGIGNGATYRMIPMIFREVHVREAAGEGKDGLAEALISARRETGTAVGFIGAIGAYGGWLIPQAYGVSAALTGSPAGAFRAFLGFYGVCLSLTWWYYLRRKFAIGWAPSFARARV